MIQQTTIARMRAQPTQGAVWLNEIEIKIMNKSIVATA
jgi:hypothetical protein